MVIIGDSPTVHRSSFVALFLFGLPLLSPAAPFGRLQAYAANVDVSITSITVNPPSSITAPTSAGWASVEGGGRRYHCFKTSSI
jgi:hypothetical protein